MTKALGQDLALRASPIYTVLGVLPQPQILKPKPVKIPGSNLLDPFKTAREFSDAWWDEVSASARPARRAGIASLRTQL